MTVDSRDLFTDLLTHLLAISPLRTPLPIFRVEEYIYYLIRYSVQQLQLRSHGSVFSTITRDTFKSLQIPFCGNDLTACFSEIVVPLFDKILSNNTQNTKLIELRDALLPKLISGELALDDLPEEIAEAAEAL